MKTMVCPECGFEVEVIDKTRRRYCWKDGYLMSVKVVKR